MSLLVAIGLLRQPSAAHYSAAQKRLYDHSREHVNEFARSTRIENAFPATRETIMSHSKPFPTEREMADEI
jgi:hypothetical protein